MNYFMCIANICSQHFKVQKCIKTTFDGIQKLPIMMILSLSREDNVSHSPVAKPMGKIMSRCLSLLRSIWESSMCIIGAMLVIAVSHHRGPPIITACLELHSDTNSNLPQLVEAEI